MSFKTGLALRSTFDILRQDAIKLVPLAALFIGLPEAAITYITGYFANASGGVSDFRTWIMVAVSMLVAILSTSLLQAMVARIASKSRRSTDFGVGDVFAVVALGLVTSLGILGGFVLLIIPGIILSLAWFVAVPVMVIERVGIKESIGRSNKLTGNARGAIFGLALVIGLASLLLGWLFQLVADAAHDTVISIVTSSVAQTISGLFNAALAVAVYNELRSSQEGSLAEDLEAIFD
ncbi:hypothetical protein BH10PSE3_BH10PSE3_22640 [soil metagenome]